MNQPQNNENGLYIRSIEIKEGAGREKAVACLTHYTPTMMHEHIVPFLDWFVSEAPHHHKVSTLTLVGEFIMWVRENTDIH